MENSEFTAAQHVLVEILKGQPNLFSNAKFSKEHGEGLAAFCSGFIAQYVANAKAMKTGRNG